MLREVLMKFFFADPILGKFLEKETHSDFAPDSAYIEALYPALGARIEEYFIPGTVRKWKDSPYEFPPALLLEGER